MPESLDIRVAVPSDLDEIATYRRTDEPGGADPARMLRYLQGEHHPTRALLPRVMLVAFDGDKQAGYVAGHLTTRFDL